MTIEIRLFLVRNLNRMLEMTDSRKQSKPGQSKYDINHSTCYISQFEGKVETTIIFSLKDEMGVLVKVLEYFQELKINLKHIESRSSKKVANHYEFVVIFHGEYDTSKLIEELKKETLYLEVISRESKLKESNTSTPWFPRRIRDLDLITDNILMYGCELDADHPGFKDGVYRDRRKHFANIARNYRQDEPIPRIEYTQIEIGTWKRVYDNVVHLYKKYACKEYNHIFPLMEENCGYRRDNIPQLEDVNRFLKDSTGFTLRPVAGLLSSRDFLAGLAHRVFHSTQYIRHHANPNYTPEPDICHELLGHAPLFADSEFARFSQEIGLASLGVSDEFIERLATCYWFTIEFGLCKQDSQIKAYGAGLLSSFGELEYAMSGIPKILPFDPVITGLQKCPITQYQPVYFLAESFADARMKLHDYASKIPRPALYHYNPYTQSVETLNSEKQVSSLAKDIKSDFGLVVESLERL